MRQVRERPARDRIKVSVAEYAVASGATLTTNGLGSCLGICVYAADDGVGALAHPMLPSRDGDVDRPAARFVDSTVDVVLAELADRGISASDVVAKVTGGASILQFDSDNGHSIGDRNVEAVRRVLDERGVTITGEEVGGDCGRTVRLDTVTGEAVVQRTDGVETVL